jgi:hypothetical protein
MPYRIASRVVDVPSAYSATTRLIMSDPSLRSTRWGTRRGERLGTRTALRQGVPVELAQPHSELCRFE